MEKTDPQFTDEEIEGIVALGEVLRGVHNRLISEGYTITEGRITPPAPTE